MNKTMIDEKVKDQHAEIDEFYLRGFDGGRHGGVSLNAGTRLAYDLTNPSTKPEI